MAKKFFDFILVSNIWVSLNVVALVALTFTELETFDRFYLIFAFAGTFVFYHYTRYFDFPKQGLPLSDTTQWLRQNQKKVLVAALLCVPIFVFGLLRFRAIPLLLLFLSAVITLYYPMVSPKKKGLRYLAGLKLVSIGLVWTIVTYYVPVLFFNEEISSSHWWGGLERFLFVTGITIPFDNRDRLSDAPDLKTFPQLLGERKSLRLAGLLIVLSIVVLHLRAMQTSVYSTASIRAQSLVLILTVFLVLKARINRSPYYFSFVLEGCSLLWFLAAWIFS